MAEVKNQAEFDKAVADGARVIYIVEGRVSVPTTTASVEAWVSASVEAWDSASVVAWDSARVEAWGSARVVAWGSASVEAWDSASVEARGSASVEARGSASVVARGCTAVRAYGRGKIDAGTAVSVHQMTDQANITGGVVILTPDTESAEGWAEQNLRRDPVDGKAILYKGVNDQLEAAHPMPDGIPAVYQPGTGLTAPDFDPAPVCGQGLHLSAHPVATLAYGQHTRFVEVEVDVAGLVPLGDKVKVRSLRVLREVDRHGDPVVSA